MSRKIGKAQIAPSAAHEFSFLTRPPLLRSESEREFSDLLSALMTEIQPHGIIEKMYVAEIAFIIWDILRYRRCKGAILNAALRHALTSLLNESSWQQIPKEKDGEIGFPELRLIREVTPAERERDRKIDNLVKRWFSSKSAKQQVSNILRNSQKDESAVEAKAIQNCSTELDWLEKMLTALEARRDRSLRRIAEYRESFADQVRAGTDRIIDTEPNQLRRLEDGTKRSAA